ncbi:MAG: imidazole glycerol phosphate synthase subunit HisH [Chthoniobacterales bacterium]|nr:imidazole glycerol phosphate synthase subunit HisH [Chthoniobacterales bacterium]
MSGSERRGAQPRVAMIDYGSGNLRSVEKALQHVGADVVRCPDPANLGECSAIVLPGVGSFGDCSRSLQERGLTAPLKQWLSAGRPYLGICLGYQILFERSEESPEAEGLGHWSGRVVRFPGRPGLKVPHMGWNDLKWEAPEPLFDGLPDPAHVFFVHSYYPVPDDAGLVTATSTHGTGFAAAAGRGSVHGVQFHPEKSQAIGLRMMENFVRGLPSED